MIIQLILMNVQIRRSFLGNRYGWLL